MSVPVTVVIATYGEELWKELVLSRALPSVRAQRVQPADVVVVHGANLAEARNEAVEQVTTPWVCVLDADDELEPTYLAAMKPYLRRTAILNPAVRFVIPKQRPKPPKVFRTRDLRSGNYVVIGALMPVELFWAAGGFDPQFRAYEDWSLTLRMVALGAKVVPVPRAVYVAHWNQQGRNNTVDKPKELMAEILSDFDAWQRRDDRS